MPRHASLYFTLPRERFPQRGHLPDFSTATAFHGRMLAGIEQPGLHFDIVDDDIAHRNARDGFVCERFIMKFDA